MKVKVRRRRVPAKMAALNALLHSPAGKQAMLDSWPAVAREMPTSTLQYLIRLHAEDRLPQMRMEVLLILLEELTRRSIKYEPGVPPKLTPSPGGRDCLGNGTWPGYECQCPDCDWYESVCFPEEAAEAREFLRY